MKLATWWIQATAGVNYYRAEMPAKHLPGQCFKLGIRDVAEDGEGGHYLPRQEGAAIWMFSGNTTRALLMADLIKYQDVPAFMEVDDNYTIAPPLAQVSSWLTTRDKEGQDRHSFEIHRRITKFCSGVICSTPHLASVYESLNSNVHVCRNSIDPDDWDTDPPHQPDGVLRIGWAGSVSHIYDLGDIRPALDWASRQRDVEIVFLGDINLGVPHRKVPWTDSRLEYHRNLHEIDVMLCPVRAGDWADCKSDVKAMEAAMGGAAVVVSKTEPYRPWWDGSAPGYVAESKKDYVRILKHLVANRDEVRESARLAREYVLQERDIRQTVKAWRDALASVPLPARSFIFKSQDEQETRRLVRELS